MTTNEQMKEMILLNRSEDYTIDMSVANFSDILESNKLSKSKFYEKMEDGRLIIPVELEQDREALDHLISKFTRSLGFGLYNIVNDNFSYEEIVENRLSENKRIEKYDLDFGQGMKFSKAMMKLMEKMKYSHLNREKVINDYSLVLNEKKLKGILVLSVNPIDFLTMSWSDTWSSCLSAGGEYESGALAYAVDEDTVLAFFISSKDKEELVANRYVNKKWRKVLVTSNQEGKESVLASRGYPYDGPMLTDEAVKHLSILLYERNMVRYDYEKVYNRIVASMSGPGYSDVGLRNQIYVYSVVEDLEDESHKTSERIRFRYGSSYNCIHCMYSEADVESFACVDCGGYEACEDCGDTISRDGGYYTAYGYMICESCLDNEYAFASDDDELYSLNDLTWLESAGEYVTDRYAKKNCDTCKECTDMFEKDEMTDTGKGFVCDDCKEEVEEEEEEATE